MKKVLSKTHRERIDEFNQYLSVLTEHNDIPRVSAAGNGCLIWGGGVAWRVGGVDTLVVGVVGFG